MTTKIITECDRCESRIIRPRMRVTETALDSIYMKELCELCSTDLKAWLANYRRK